MLGPVASKEYVLKHLNIYDAHALKKYGQNFLVDDNLAKKIVDEIRDDESATILEIGPGLGALTYHLLNKKANKVLVEIDPLMCDHLVHQINDENIRIINKDFLRLDLNEFGDNLIVVGNLPYYITTDIIEKLVKAKNVSQMILMVQKEAFDRLTAKVNTKEYAPISIFLEYVGGVELISRVSRHSYIPEPHVDSLVFQINVNKKESNIDEINFFKVTKAMFLMRRKTILNNLTNYLKDKNKAEKILGELNCSTSTRPEQLDLDFYLKLAKKLKNNIF